MSAIRSPREKPNLEPMTGVGVVGLLQGRSRNSIHVGGLHLRAGLTEPHRTGFVEKRYCEAAAISQLGVRDNRSYHSKLLGCCGSRHDHVDPVLNVYLLHRGFVNR
jgi:hypothetical protein